MSRKADIVERLVSMSHLGLTIIQADTDDADPELPSLSYLTNNVRMKLKLLPKFSEVDLWSKKISGVILDFTFMNLLENPFYRRNKTFDMELIWAFKPLKACTFLL